MHSIRSKSTNGMVEVNERN